MAKNIVLILIVLLILILFKRINNIQPFTFIRGIRQPLVSYDDYSTFDFKNHLNDLPNYDPTYHNLGCTIKHTDVDNVEWKCGGNNKYGLNSYIDFEGNLIRRKMIPSNYADHPEYTIADWTTNSMHIIVKPDRPKESTKPPQPYNIFYGIYPS